MILDNREVYPGHSGTRTGKPKLPDKKIRRKIMKSQSNNHLSGRRLILPALTVLALSLLTIPTSAKAGIRVGVKVKTPAISAVFHSGGHGPGLHVKIHPRYRDYQITKIDRKIARKLAKRTIYTRRELIQLRRAVVLRNPAGLVI